MFTAASLQIGGSAGSLHVAFALRIRPVGPGDIAALLGYFERLSTASHYNRFLGATRGPKADDYRPIVEGRAPGHFALLAEMMAGDETAIIGEARYVVEAVADAAEIALSVNDAWRRRGIGAALLDDIECRAAASGASRVFGDTLAGNRGMLGLARSRDYRLTHPPGDWTLVRFTKQVRAPASCNPVTDMVQRAAAGEGRTASL